MREDYHSVMVSQYRLVMYLAVINTSSMDKDPIVAARRERLRVWIATHHGTPAEYLRVVNKKAKLNQGELSGLLGAKSFREKKAANLEAISPGMPAGYLVNPLDQVPGAAAGDAIEELKGDVLYLRAVLNAVLISLSRSTPAVASSLRQALATTPGSHAGYAKEALDLVCETQADLFERELSDLRGGERQGAKRIAKQASR